jgi:hypothetical protein
MFLPWHIRVRNIIEHIEVVSSRGTSKSEGDPDWMKKGSQFIQWHRTKEQ